MNKDELQNAFKWTWNILYYIFNPQYLKTLTFTFWPKIQ